MNAKIMVETLDGVEFYFDEIQRAKSAKLVGDTLTIINLYNIKIEFYRSNTIKYADGLGGSLKPADFDKLVEHFHLRNYHANN